MFLTKNNWNFFTTSKATFFNAPLFELDLLKLNLKKSTLKKSPTCVNLVVGNFSTSRCNVCFLHFLTVSERSGFHQSFVLSCLASNTEMQPLG